MTLQFAAPLILCLYLTLMYKSLGGFSWSGIFRESVVLQHECAASETEGAGVAVSQGDGDFNIIESAQSLQASFSSLKNVRILALHLNASFNHSFFFRFSPRRCTRVSWALPPGGATSPYSPLHRWALSTNHISTRPRFI